VVVVVVLVLLGDEQRGPSVSEGVEGEAREREAVRVGRVEAAPAARLALIGRPNLKIETQAVLPQSIGQVTPVYPVYTWFKVQRERTRTQKRQPRASPLSADPIIR